MSRDAEAVLIRRLLADGLNAMALDRVRHVAQEEGERTTPEILFLGALASVRVGANADAQAWLDRVDFESIEDADLAVDLWSLAGRIAKDRYAAQRTTASDVAQSHAAIALAHYRRAFDAGGAYYPAVNAATMAMLLGRREDSRRLAEQALAACERDAGPEHWRHASRGEALLLLGRVDEARAAYDLARDAARGSFGDVASMRRQLLLIGTAEAQSLLERLPAPVVIAFAGHMIDHPERSSPRFPAALEPRVADALRARIAGIGPAIGFSQAACGADILFLEAMQDAGMQTHVVLPCATRDFLASSVEFAGASWVERFEAVMARATSRLLATDEPLLGDHVLFAHASKLIHGMAVLRASELQAEPLLLTVRDHGGVLHQGGTASTVDEWTKAKRRVETIDLATLRGSPPGVNGDRMPAAPVVQGGRTLRTLLFADIKGFSRIPEQFTPRFADLFLGICKRLLDGLEHKAVDANTRGDGIFVVFDRPVDAAAFAVRLQRELAEIDWTSLSLPADTRARIGLHTGPVFKTYDPVMGKPTFYGTHVNLTARLEPIVQPGHIFATEAFAATLVADGGQPFQCHYIGEMPLAKRFGDARLYRLAEPHESRHCDLIKSVEQ